MRPLKTKMAWEWNWPRFWTAAYQFEWFEVSFYTAHNGDHSPGLHFLLVVLNLVLVDCGYYNIYHEPDDEVV
jgi:hypothetical protein